MAETTEPVSAKKRAKVGRRRFLTYLIAAPTLTVAVKLGEEQASAGPVLPGTPGLGDLGDLGDMMTVASAPTGMLMVLEVTESGQVRFELPRAEVGQGMTTSVAMIIAEEMGIGVDDVTVELSPARQELAFNQFTGMSTSIRTLWGPLRFMAAGARARLLAAAGEKWSVSAETLDTKGKVVVAADGRTAGFGSLSGLAARLTTVSLPGTPKRSADYTVLGKPTVRIDARDIVTGKAKYTLDTDVPDALPTIVARPPTINGTVSSFDDSVATAMAGTVAITEIPTGVAVTAKTFHDAIKARDALRIQWGGGSVDGMSDPDIRAKLSDETPGFLGAAGFGDTLEAEFDFGFVPHAPMEVASAIADVRAKSAEIWCAAQTPLVAQRDIAKALKMSTGSVTLNVVRAGGSFGRWLFFDAALEAAQVSKAIGKPVKLMWTRNDDMRHGRMRPASHHKLRVKHTKSTVLSFEHRMASVSVDFKHGLGEALSAGGSRVLPTTIGQLVFHTCETVPYNFGLVSQSLKEVDLDMHTGSWRSVHSATFRAAEELLVDELAGRFGKDPVRFRMEYLKDKAAKNVLQMVTDKGSWGRAMPRGFGQGVAVHEEHRSTAACLVEIDATDKAAPRVTKAVIAVDIGQVINPRGVQAQMSGGLMDAISTVLQAGAHVDDGAVREGSFSDFNWARQRNSPVDIEVHIVRSDRHPGGVGELSVPVAAGAVANAYARATGSQPRQFPINF